MILKWNYAFIIKILQLFKIYAQILIAHSSSILGNIGLHFSLKCPKRYILRYQFIKLDKNAKTMMPIFQKNLLYINGRLSKIRSLHTYVMHRMFYFEQYCM